jgi:hypothetical protein
VTSGVPPELVSTPFSGQASRAGIDTYLWRGRTVLPVFDLRNQSKPIMGKFCFHLYDKREGRSVRYIFVKLSKNRTYGAIQSSLCSIFVLLCVLFRRTVEDSANTLQKNFK